MDLLSVCIYIMCALFRGYKALYLYVHSSMCIHTIFQNSRIIYYFAEYTRLEFSMHLCETCSSL